MQFSSTVGNLNANLHLFRLCFTCIQLLTTVQLTAIPKFVLVHHCLVRNCTKTISQRVLRFCSYIRIFPRLTTDWGIIIVSSFTKLIPTSFVRWLQTISNGLLSWVIGTCLTNINLAMRSLRPHNLTRVNWAFGTLIKSITGFLMQGDLWNILRL
jgi:hypothetical protein